MSSGTQSSNKRGDVVYRRLANSAVDTSKGEEPKDRSPASERLAPTLRPLLIGFTLLLVLVIALGVLSVRRLDSALHDVTEPRDQLLGQMRRLLQIQVVTARLYNEAQARMRRIERPSEEVRPLFGIPLDKARRDAVAQAEFLERPPLNETPEWQALRKDMTEFVNATQDESTYTLKGFTAFRTVSTDLDNIQRKLEEQRLEVVNRGEKMQLQASRTIYLLTFAAFGVGILVVVASVREVQRRFYQTRLSEENARRERLFSTQMLEGMVSAVAALDSRDRIVSANAAFFNLFPEATIGASVYDRFGPSQSLAMLEAAASRRVDRATYFGRWPVTIGKIEESFDLYVSPLAIDGESGQVIAMVDVTEVAEAESALRRSEALAAVGQAAAQLAHEIKNPLGSIRLGVSMLRDSTHDPESINTLDLVERGIMHLNNLVVDVTQFSREKVLAPSPVDLSELLESSFELVIDKLHEKGTVARKTYASQPIVSLWDEDQLRQVFVNLLGNAIDASSPNSVIEVSTNRIQTNHSRKPGGRDFSVNGAAGIARIEITDHGKGMTEETLTRIFEPFFTTKRRGTGLGLAVVKKIIELHNGNIDVQSKIDNGTTFTIDLPLAPASAVNENENI